jgi:glycosyltransferase involved in cell wall biosynthesis
MRLALLTDNFSKQTGYMSNALPRALARLGADVHLVTMDLPPYYRLPNFESIYSEFTGRDALKPGTREAYDGYTLHVLGHERLLGHMRYVGLRRALGDIRPDVVQSLPAIGWIPVQAAMLRARFGYALFTGSHTTASVFPLYYEQRPFWDPKMVANFLTRYVPGRLVSFVTEKCYGATTDCAEVAVRFFGVQKTKIDVCPLGVETEMFHPALSNDETNNRICLRKELGVQADAIVCIYTGRFTEDKNPLLLAQAVSTLRRNDPRFVSVFLGDGPQVDKIRQCDGAIVRPFIPYKELQHWYRASDIGVWPAQESTSMLDAAACGLPIVVNSTLRAKERVDGNGLTYELNDVDDLRRVLNLLSDAETRNELGRVGARRMAELFSWEAIARRRLADYTAARFAVYDSLKRHARQS